MKRLLPFILLAACLWLLFGGKLPEWNVLAPAKPTAVTYFYDDKQHVIPSGVHVAIDKLNRSGLMATKHEVDTTDSSGDVPEQYKVSLPAAKEVGLPSLVVMSGDKVLRTVKDPQTEQAVMEAAQ